jgi:hypothetical protein
MREMFGDDANVTELCEKIGISRQTLYKAYDRDEAKGYSSIDTRVALEIRKLTGRSMSWILTGEEDAPREPDLELRAARRVARVVAGDMGLPLPVARELVGRIALDDAAEWADDLELYRIVRAAAGVPSVKSHSTVPKPKLLGVGQKVPSGKQR